MLKIPGHLRATTSDRLSSKDCYRGSLAGGFSILGEMSFGAFDFLELSIV